MRKIWVVLVLVASLMPASALADSLSVNVKDKYVIGKGINVYDGPVVQTDLFVNLPHGLYADIWWSVSADNSDVNGDFGDEVDYTLGWSGEAYGLTLDANFSYFDLVKLFSTNGGDALNPNIDVSKSFSVGNHTLTPYVRTEIYVPIEWSADAKSGVHLFWGVKHQWRLTDRIAVNQKLAAFYDTGTFVASDSGILGHYDIGIGWKVRDNFTINAPTLKVIFPISSLNDGRTTEHILGGGVTLTFN